jgi:hypothetical protein
MKHDERTLIGEKIGDVFKLRFQLGAMLDI